MTRRNAPGKDTIPPNARVASYPVADRIGLTWVWIGPPDEAVADGIFDLAQYHDPAWAVGYRDARYVDANYLLPCDDPCDPSHVVYVHPTTLGNPGENSAKVTYDRPTGASGRRAGPSTARPRCFAA